MLKRLSILLTCLASVFTFSACSLQYEHNYYERGDIVFGSSITMVAYLMGKKAVKAYDEMYMTVRQINDEINISDTDSLLYRFNEGKSAKVEISQHLYNILMLAKQYYSLTDGAFNPSTVTLSKMWKTDSEGINKYGADKYGYEYYSPIVKPSFELPTYEDALSLANSAAMDMDNLICSTQGGKYYMEKTVDELKLDLGGIAKGYAADICAKIAKDYKLKSALIDISGNLVLYNQLIEDGVESDWNILVTNPRYSPQNDIACVFTVGGGISCVTSGDYNRYYFYESEYYTEPLWVNHIMNPSSGMPAGIVYSETTLLYENTDDRIISATIICQSSAMADALSTAVFVMGEDGIEFIKEQGLSAIVFTTDTVYYTSDIEFVFTDIYNAYKGYKQVQI